MARTIGMVMGADRRRSLLHRAFIPVLSGLVISTTGCGLQSEIIQARHWDLNETIRATHDEQLLLNLVRLRYDETPFFLQVSGITTSFSAGANLGLSGSFPEKGANVLGASAGVSYAEVPTVTWSLPDSREFLGRLHAPMGADQLTVLTQAGLDPALVLRVGVRKMNRLRNLEFDIVDGVLEPDGYRNFREALNLIDELRREDLIDLAYGVYSNSGGAKVPIDKLDMQAMADGIPLGLQFMTRDDPNFLEPLKLSKPLFMRFSLLSDTDPRARRLRALLDLDPSSYSFAFVDTGNSGPEQFRSESGRPSQVFDPTRKFKEIVVSNRSVMEMLRFASAYVEAPREDLARGVVRGRAPAEGPWLRIRNSNGEPANTWLKVQHSGNWYYIAADDLDSRLSFTLLNALFSSVVGDVPGARPLLTLPVR